VIATHSLHLPAWSAPADQAKSRQSHEKNFHVRPERHGRILGIVAIAIAWLTKSLTTILA